MSFSVKERDYKEIKLPEPIPVIRRQPIWGSVRAKLVGLRWKKKDHPDAILLLEDGKVEIVTHYNTDEIRADPGPGLKILKEIDEVKAEQNKVAAKFNEAINALNAKVPILDLNAIIDEYEAKLKEKKD